MGPRVPTDRSKGAGDTSPWRGEASLPEGKAACARLLRSLGYKPGKIDAIQQPAGDQPGRVFVLSRKIYFGPNDWRRRATTVVIHFEDDEVRAEELSGWVVR